MRDDKDAVLDMLFAAFEKHQYYNIKDLVKITRQPVVSFNKIYIYTIIYNFLIYIFYVQVYLKEILSEVCSYNIKNPHRNMWELKPEYRHYKAEEKPAADATAGKDESEDSS